MRVAICDDEIKMRELLAAKVRRLCPDADIVLVKSGSELLSMEPQPEILFLDIGMPKMSGMEAARALRENNKSMVLIFVTAFAEYVFQAFDVGAFHYLVKPFTDEKFAEVFCAAVA